MKRYYLNIVENNKTTITVWGKWETLSEVITNIQRRRLDPFIVDSILLIEDV